jgi:hypothetical protein
MRVFAILDSGVLVDFWGQPPDVRHSVRNPYFANVHPFDGVGQFRWVIPIKILCEVHPTVVGVNKTV